MAYLHPSEKQNESILLDATQIETMRLWYKYENCDQRNIIKPSEINHAPRNN